MTITAVPSQQTSTDDERRRRLRVMRTVATSLLVLAAVVFTLTRNQDGWLGFVHAGAEAAMVGAIADWFAVTALFKHPLGLPIPHTALVPRKKEQLGASLQDFVSANFLRPEIVRERIAEIGVSARLGRWLGDVAHARRLVDEGSAVAADVLEAVRDDDVDAMLRDLVIPRLLDEPVSPVLGQFLHDVVAERAHHGLVELMLGELGRWLDRHPERMVELVVQRAPSWAPHWANRLVAERLLREARAWVEDVRTDPSSPARGAMDAWLADLAEDLRHDPDTAAAAERLKTRLLAQPSVRVTALRIWQVLRGALIGALRDDSGLLRRRLRDEVARFATRLQDDPALAARVDRLAEDAAGAVVQRYGPDIATIISATVERWDGVETARRMELQVGRDLQFIRVNGTIVGGLVGVLLHSASLPL